MDVFRSDNDTGRTTFRHAIRSLRGSANENELNSVAFVGMGDDFVFGLALAPGTAIMVVSFILNYRPIVTQRYKCVK
jgi:hypothetical protein